MVLWMHSGNNFHGQGYKNFPALARGFNKILGIRKDPNSSKCPYSSTRHPCHVDLKYNQQLNQVNKNCAGVKSASTKREFSKRDDEMIQDA